MVELTGVVDSDCVTGVVDSSEVVITVVGKVVGSDEPIK